MPIHLSGGEQTVFKGQQPPGIIEPQQTGESVEQQAFCPATGQQDPELAEQQPDTFPVSSKQHLSPLLPQQWKSSQQTPSLLGQQATSILFCEQHGLGSQLLGWSHLSVSYPIRTSSQLCEILINI